MWTFRWIRSWEEVWHPDHRALWRQIVECRAGPDANPFMHPDVVRAWFLATDAAARSEPLFVEARRDDGVQVILLMVCLHGDWRHGLVRRCAPVAFFDYQDPVVTRCASEASALAGFWGAFRRELESRAGSWFDVCSFQRLRSDTGPGTEAKPADVTAPYLRLSRYSDFDAYLASRTKFRSKVRDSKLQFRVHSSADIDAVYGWIPALEAARRERYPGSELPPGYLRALVAEGMQSGIVHCSSLALEGQAISWHVGLWSNGTLFWYIPAFDARRQAVSPGTVHLAKAIEWVFARGGHTFDFLLGAEAYKSVWTDGAEFELRSARIRSRALASRGRFLAGRIGSLIRSRGPASIGAS
jgi:CelD/BcsL family acetyltransferase involved in cellulose biosynthesis